MWKDFDGKPYNRASLAARIAALKFDNWKPSFIVYHNTSEPTIKLWLSWSETKRQQYIYNVEQMYEVDDHWHAGPHFFVPPTMDPCCFGFSNPVASGVHASCFNGQSIGIEQVGEFNVESYNDGPGAIVRDNAVYLGALLYRKLGLVPSHDTLKFHIECARDNHDCPGTSARDKDALIARIKAEMARQSGGPILVPQPSAPAKRFTDIVATEFGGGGDEQPSAYADIKRGWPSRPGVALPFRFTGPRPMVRVFGSGRSVDCPIVDVGPWNGKTPAKSDPYWVNGTRPQAESGVDLNGRRTNKAGIDLTPAAARAVGVNGKGVVDWEFIGDAPAKPVAAPGPVPAPTLPGAKTIALTGIAGTMAVAIGWFDAHPGWVVAIGLISAAVTVGIIELIKRHKE